MTRDPTIVEAWVSLGQRLLLGQLNLFKITQFEKHFAFFILVETNFEIKIRKFHKILLILSKEKDVFSILVNETLLYFLSIQ